MTTNKPVVNLALDPALLQRIDEFWHQHMFNSRAEAMRQLLITALDKKLAPAAKKAGN